MKATNYGSEEKRGFRIASVVVALAFGVLLLSSSIIPFLQFGSNDQVAASTSYPGTPVAVEYGNKWLRLDASQTTVASFQILKATSPGATQIGNMGTVEMEFDLRVNPLTYYTEAFYFNGTYTEYVRFRINSNRTVQIDTVSGGTTSVYSGVICPAFNTWMHVSIFANSTSSNITIDGTALIGTEHTAFTTPVEMRFIGKPTTANCGLWDLDNLTFVEDSTEKLFLDFNNYAMGATSLPNIAGNGTYFIRNAGWTSLSIVGDEHYDWRVRWAPYPYGGVIAIASDIDQTTEARYDFFHSWAEDNDIVLGDSFWAYASVSSEPAMRWYETVDSSVIRNKTRILDEIRQGTIDTVHTIGDWNTNSTPITRPTRSQNLHVINELIANDLRLYVMVDHGNQNNWQDWPYLAGGSDPANGSYNSDLWASYGIMFHWGADWMGPLISSSLNGSSPGGLIHPTTLNDGTSLWEFVRHGFTGPIGQVGYSVETEDLDNLLTDAYLTNLEKNRTAIIYTHLGTDWAGLLIDTDVDGIYDWQEGLLLAQSKNLWIANLSSTLSYSLYSQYLDYSITNNSGTYILQLNDLRGAIPTVVDYDFWYGHPTPLTFYIPDYVDPSHLVVVTSDGVALPFEANIADAIGFESITLGRTKLPIYTGVTYDVSSSDYIYGSGLFGVPTGLLAYSTGSVELTASEWTDSRMTWVVDAGILAPSVTFTLTGLDSTVGYKVYVDGEEIYRQRSGHSSITFTYSGPWSEHEFEVKVWAPYQMFEDVAMMAFYVGLAIGFAAILMVAVFSRVRRG